MYVCVGNMLNVDVQCYFFSLSKSKFLDSVDFPHLWSVIQISSYPHVSRAAISDIIVLAVLLVVFRCMLFSQVLANKFDWLIHWFIGSLIHCCVFIDSLIDWLLCIICMVCYVFCYLFQLFLYCLCLVFVYAA